jgi:hypothetical protein
VSTNSNRILVAGDAHLYLAAVGTTMPSNATSAPSAASALWTEVGLFTQDSLQFVTDPSFEEVKSHQSFYATRTIQTGDTAHLAVELQEWSTANFKAVYGGGTVTNPSGGVYKFVPPAPGSRSETAALLDITDGSKHYRLCLPRTAQREGVGLDLHKGNEAVLALNLGVLDPGTGIDPWFWLTDDSAFTP